MTPIERVLTALSHKEPDRVPLILLTVLQGARELNMSIKEYFSKPENVAEGQTILQEKYSIDCYYSFYYASTEIEAFGGDTIFIEDGPPNAGAPIIKDFKDIENLQPPKVKDSEALQKTLKTIEILSKRADGKIPIFGAAISPFSLPVMQMGFGKYIDLIYGNRELFNHLMKVNEEFYVDWANAQIEAGATAVTYFDPVSSPTIIPRELFIETGHKIAKRTFSQIDGASAMHFASGNCLQIADLLPDLGIAAVGVSVKEDLAELKKAFKNKIAVLGNMNGIEMKRWTPDQAKAKVKDIIRTAAEGGGFLLGENHGEVPFQVGDEVLSAISRAVKEFGNYPIDRSS